MVSVKIARFGESVGTSRGIRALHKPVFPGAVLDLDFVAGRGYATVAPGHGLASSFLSVTNGVTNGAAYALDAAGLAIPFADNTARITNLGLTSEEARTTLVPKSRRLDDGAVWTASSITPSEVMGVDGVLASATRLSATGANGTITGPATSLASAARRLDPFVRRVSGTGDIDISLDNGSTYTTLTGLTSSYQRLGKGQTLANPQIKIRIVSSGDEVDIDFCGGETGSFATSPIESGDVAAQRLADVNTTTRPGQAEGAILLDAITHPTQNNAANQVLWVWSDGSANNRITIIRAANTGSVSAQVHVSGSAVFSKPLGILAEGTRAKIACRWKESDFAAIMTGNSIQTQASGAVPTGLTTIHRGVYVSGALSWNSNIYRETLFPTLSDAQLTAGVVL